MQTHLEEIEGLERWQAWAGAGVQQFIQVKHGDHEVTLSRWDVHTMLEGATTVVFSTPGAGGRTTYARAYSTGQEHHGPSLSDIVVERPADAGEWIQELIELGEMAREKFFQVGSWIVRVGPPDYYAHVVASTDPGAAAAYRAGGDDYKTMFRSSAQCKDRTAVLMGFLQGQPLLGTPPEMARLAVAMCASEAARNHRTWGINLMLMDLLRGNAVPGGWRSLIEDEMHPMSKGGTFEHGKVGMKGGKKSRETWAHETGVTMLWLTKFAGVQAGMADDAQRRWRDPAKGEAFRGAVRGRLTDALVARLRKVSWGWE